MIVLYAFSRPFLLDEQIQISENQNFYRSHILKVIMRVPIMCFFAIIFSFIFFQLVGGANMYVETNRMKSGMPRPGLWLNSDAP